MALHTTITQTNVLPNAVVLMLTRVVIVFPMLLAVMILVVMEFVTIILMVLTVLLILVLDQWNCLLPDVSVSPLPSLVYTIQVDLRLVFSVEVVVIVMVLNRANPTIFTVLVISV